MENITETRAGSSMRKHFKQAGRRVFHKNYLLLVFLGLILALFGTENKELVSLLKMQNPLSTEAADEQDETQITSILNADDVYIDIASGDFGKGLRESDESLQTIQETESGNTVLGRSSGVLAGLVN